jgi:hypothetical protein
MADIDPGAAEQMGHFPLEKCRVGIDKPMHPVGLNKFVDFHSIQLVFEGPEQLQRTIADARGGGSLLRDTGFTGSSA